MPAQQGLRLGLALSTIGRPAVHDMLRSAAESRHPPAAVVIADQSELLEPAAFCHYPFPVTVVASSGGVSRGRNQAAALLADVVDVLGFPNDDTLYPPATLGEVLHAFDSESPPAAVCCGLVDQEALRFVMPPPGTPMSRRTVWRAVEPATFYASAWWRRTTGFREYLGSGAGTPWGSGEGTDLLLRIIDLGGRAVSRPDLRVHGPGERRDLDPTRLVAKHRAYARGTGFVYRAHRYSLAAKARTLLGPFVRFGQFDRSPLVGGRLAAARFLGRLEGMTGTMIERARVPSPRPDSGLEGQARPAVLGAVIPTVGRIAPLQASLRSLDACAAAGIPLQVVVVAQGSLELDPANYPHLELRVHQDDGRGASRARNVGLGLLGSQVTHVLWPNDHTEYDPDGLLAVVRHARRSDVVVGVLDEPGGSRYALPPAGSPLDRSTVWAAIEPATATAVSAVHRAGGWREDLGTGSSAPWQSSAFADLLLRIMAADGGSTTVAWTRDFHCSGQGFVRGSSRASLRRKARTYGRGYGRVLRTWRYPLPKLIGTVVKPLAEPRFAVGPDVLPYSVRMQLALGRLEGALGRVLPTSRPDLRPGDDLRR